MRTHLTVLLAAGFVAATTSGSYAGPQRAPAPVCNLVRDGAGDTEWVPANSMDILGGDISSDSRNLTAVIRLKAWAEIEPTSPQGRLFVVRFKSVGAQKPAFLSYLTTPTGGIYEYGYRDGTDEIVVGEATGSIDSDRQEIRMTAPVEKLSRTGNDLRRGMRIGGIEAFTGKWVGNPYAPGVPVLSTNEMGLVMDVDIARTNKVYVAGARSCVKPG